MPHRACGHTIAAAEVLRIRALSAHTSFALVAIAKIRICGTYIAGVCLRHLVVFGGAIWYTIGVVMVHGAFALYACCCERVNYLAVGIMAVVAFYIRAHPLRSSRAWLAELLSIAAVAPTDGIIIEPYSIWKATVVEASTWSNPFVVFANYNILFALFLCNLLACV